MKYWRYYDNNKKNPHEIVVDNSDALILASVQAFTSLQTRNAYLDACFDNLFNNSGIEIGCYIRLDRSHIVKQILTMEVSEKLDYRVRRLLQRILGFLITVSDVEIVAKIIKNLFTILLNKFEHIEAVTEAKWHLKKISDDHDIDDIMNNPDIDEMDECQEILFNQEESKFKSWIKNIIQDVREKYVDESLNDSIGVDDAFVENLYYVPETNKDFFKYLIEFLAIIPLWSNIMMDSFHSKNSVATSSPTEATFKDIKVIVFKNEKGYRTDIFAEKYVTYLLGNFKFALADSKNKQSFALERKNQENRENFEGACSLRESDNEKEEESIQKAQKVEVAQEIWRNKNVDVPQKIKLVKSNRSVNSILEKSKPFSSHLPILPNGGTTKGTGKTPTIISQNTCVFDVLYEIWAAFYKDIPAIKAEIDKSDYQFDKFIRDSFLEKNIDSLKNTRNHLLLTLFPEKVFHGVKNMKTINVFMTINEMFFKLSDNSSVIFSAKAQGICECCSFVNSENIYKYVPTTFKGDWANIIENIEAYTNELENFSCDICKECFSQLDTHILLNDVLVVNIEMAYPNKDIYDFELEKISKHIIFEQQRFEFRAAIEYSSNHFIAHIKRNNQVWETYDDLKSLNVQKTPKSFYSVQYYYVKMRND